MTELKKPAWLRDAELYCSRVRRQLEAADNRAVELTKTIARLTEENIDLKRQLSEALRRDASADDAENAALELKESRELVKQSV
jgi:hypothetical protein